MVSALQQLRSHVDGMMCLPQQMCWAQKGRQLSFEASCYKPRSKARHVPSTERSHCHLRSMAE